MTEKELILTHLSGCSRDAIYCRNFDKSLNLKLNKILEKRKEGIPLQYLLGNVNFMGLDFKVDRRALIPRFETELLVEKTIDIINGLNLKEFNLLDLCAGSGCIAIAIAKNFRNAKITATDISKDALSLAGDNALLNKVSLEIEFLESDLFQKIKGRHYNIITCNPPYIPSQEFKNLSKEISYEPRLALDGKKDGLDFYRQILKDAHFYLEKNGFLIFEIGFVKTNEVTELIKANINLKLIEVIKDYNNFDRVLIIKNG